MSSAINNSSSPSPVASPEVPYFGDTPSGRCGVPWDIEQAQIRKLCSFVRETGNKLQLPHWTMTTALILCHKFYRIHSLTENDPFIIGIGSVFLAGKIQNTPKSPKEILVNGWEIRSRKKPDEMNKLSQLTFLEEMRKHLIQAEELLLYAIDFDFDVSLPFPHAVMLLEEIKPQSPALQQKLNGLAIRFLDDIMMGSFCVDYKVETLAAGAISIACFILNVPVDRCSLWREAELERADDVISDIFKFYKEVYLEAPVEQKSKPNPFIANNDKNSNNNNHHNSLPHHQPHPHRYHS